MGQGKHRGTVHLRESSFSDSGTGIWGTFCKGSGGLHLREQDAYLIQALRAAVTALDRVFQENQTLIVQSNSGSISGPIVGGIKTGYKHLFLVNDEGQYLPTAALCVLDFYVHESCQRSGIGKMLFDEMLNHHGTMAVRLAYDRPSSKLTSFLAKHCNLVQQCPQPNHFMIYKGFFSGKDHMHTNKLRGIRCEGGMSRSRRNVPVINSYTQGNKGTAENVFLEQQRLMARRSSEHPELPFIASRSTPGRCMDFNDQKLGSSQRLEPVVLPCDTAQPPAISTSHQPAAAGGTLKIFKQSSRGVSHTSPRQHLPLRSKRDEPRQVVKARAGDPDACKQGHARQAGSLYEHQTRHAAADRAHDLVHGGHH